MTLVADAVKSRFESGVVVGVKCGCGYRCEGSFSEGEELEPPLVVCVVDMMLNRVVAGDMASSPSSGGLGNEWVDDMTSNNAVPGDKIDVAGDVGLKVDDSSFVSDGTVSEREDLEEDFEVCEDGVEVGVFSGICVEKLDADEVLGFEGERS